MVSDVMGQCQQLDLQCSVYFYKRAHEFPVLDRRPGSNDLELDFRWVGPVSCARIFSILFTDFIKMYNEKNIRALWVGPGKSLATFQAKKFTVLTTQVRTLEQ